MRTTVAIPLFRSSEWLDVVERNVRRLQGVARIIVSDPLASDDSLEVLRERLADLDVQWLGTRPIEPGWVPHCEELRQRSTTEFFMWLPHDDDIDADWVRSGERALDSEPAAILALGSVRSADGGREIPVSPAFQRDSAADRVRSALAEVSSGDVQLLGAAYRGVFRREQAVELPRAIPGDQWSDVLWAVRMLTRGSFAATNAVYVKRWHDANTHGNWTNPRSRPELYRALESFVAELPPAERTSATPPLWRARMRVVAALRRAARR
ncbi:hypothetical protein [Antiquaquibacter soli]|uniref:Glycosyltransferase n=1 Tax=Antiquaquibacter soli TaxID=3064523 RepID=A0ABT9BNI3_9MICO|nr:hypothetical protein [Protaetiibacter sp. WY-16]MDO7882598.1 hypothetical protein [Protaetiibacter sp. WY-16]